MYARTDKRTDGGTHGGTHTWWKYGGNLIRGRLCVSCVLLLNKTVQEHKTTVELLHIIIRIYHQNEYTAEDACEIQIDVFMPHVLIRPSEYTTVCCLLWITRGHRKVVSVVQ